MEKKLYKFLDEAFAPYGEFPARSDVTQELLANLLEKYNDLKKQGKTDEEAYAQTVESFGDVSEIMEHIDHTKNPEKQTEKKSIASVIVDSIKHPIRGDDSRFRATSLIETDLAGTDLAGSDFSMSALMGANFDTSNLRESKFKAAALKGASFVGSDMTGATFDSSDLTEAVLDGANLSEAKFRRCAFKGSTFENTVLDNTEFKQSDLSEISFDGQTLRGTIFDSSSLKKTTFNGAILEDVSFHHSDTKKAIFAGATMDKVTYALLKGMKTNLENVTRK